MLLLVTDTSGKHGCVALAHAEEPGEVRVIEEVPLAGGTFSAQLVPQISGLLAKHRFRRDEIGAFVVVSGPGSFTGLRVGLAAIKALAEVLHKPIVPVSLLEIVALASGRQGRVLAAVDAGRGEVYVGEYEASIDSVQLVRESLLSKDEFRSATCQSVIAAADEALSTAAGEAGGSVLQVAHPRAAMIARLGWKKLQTGMTVSPQELDANYIRRSDAEIFPKPAS